MMHYIFTFLKLRFIDFIECKFISKMISPLFGKTQSYVKNSTHFMQTVNSVCLRSDKNDGEF